MSFWSPGNPWHRAAALAVLLSLGLALAGCPTMRCLSNCQDTRGCKQE